MAKQFLDEFKRFSIHEHEFNQLPKSLQDSFMEYEDMDYQFLLNNRDRTKKVKSLIRKYMKEIQKNKGKESNGECCAIDFIVYLLQHMSAKEIRKLHLEKLLK
jgi:hypothetical protein